MLLEIAKTVNVGSPLAEAWPFVRDVESLSQCLPNVTDVKELEADRRYSAVVAEKLGPFKLQVPVEISLSDIQEQSGITAQLAGNDSRGQARVKGTLQARLEPHGTGTELTLTMHMEVLGKLATLGAGPMRRRADEVFSQFVRCVEARLGTREARAV